VINFINRCKDCIGKY